MSARIIDGKAVAAQVRERVRGEVAALDAQPGLATVLVGDDPASHVYVRNKRRACERVGMASLHRELPAATSQDELLAVVTRWTAVPAGHGTLVQLPLPPQIEERAVIESVSPLKDVDAFHPETVGLLAAGHPRFLPCTPHGIQQLLIRNEVPVAGAHVVIVGRSNIVGKPLALMLMQKGPGGDATVTVAHSRSRDLAAVTRSADI